MKKYLQTFAQRLLGIDEPLNDEELSLWYGIAFSLFVLFILVVIIH